MKALILKSIIFPNSSGLPQWQTEDVVFYRHCKRLIHLLAVVNWYLYFFIPKEKSAIFSCYRIKLSPSGHGCWKSHHLELIHLTGSLNRPPVATNTIWSISDCLFGNLVREHDPGYPNSYWFPPAHTYVFFVFFSIGNLSFLDFWYTSAYTPRILATCISEDKCFSLAECGAQLFFSCVVAYTECYLLAAMAYDRHMAICNPLLYSSSMSHSLCTRLVAGSYTGGFLNAIAHTANTFRLSFCGKNIIDHFFCDAPPLVKMSCTDTKVYEQVLLGLVGFTVLSSILVIIISYYNLLLAILRIRTASGRCKAFSTCASHLVSVTLFYGSLLFMYSRPSSTYSLKRDKVAALFYTLINPLLNPVIYSLKNKDVKEAFWKAAKTIRPQR